MELNVGFIILESGGLLQAGSYAGDGSHRFKSRLRIQLTHMTEPYPAWGKYADLNTDYATAPVTSSQYSGEVHHPGVTFEGSFQDFAGGSALSNAGGPKAIAVNFNGNYQLNGWLPQAVPYKGTWSVEYASADGTAMPERGEALQPLTLKSSFWPEEYPMTWARLVNGGAAKGDVQLQLDLDDLPPAPRGEMWGPGDKILITARTQVFTDLAGPANIPRNMVGMPRSWLDDPEGSQDYEDNRDANNFTFRCAEAGCGVPAPNPHMAPLLGGHSDDSGVEVAMVVGMSENGTITLAGPLKFNHTSVDKVLQNKAGGTARVQTRLHVGWLSRRITVTSLQSSQEASAGCNQKLHPTSTLNGPQGAIEPNFGETGSVKDVGNEVYTRCYNESNRVPGWEQAFAGSEQPVQDVRGHWMLGTAGLRGCNAIWGGQQIFRYGASVSVDGVEVTKMGTAGNFGNMGQYAIHFHLAGFANSFKGYLPAGAAAAGYARELRVENSAIWRTYVRWVTLHGTAEAIVRNNVAFLTYGSGFFVEDGAEYRNVFDHNMGIMAMTAQQNAYWNPSPIYPFVSTDYGPMSTFWFKNNQNCFTRNVAANSPTPVLAVWYVPQLVGNLRGSATLLIGSEPLQLPGVASQANAVGDVDCGKGVAGLSSSAIGTSGRCYVPPGFTFPLLSPETGCIVFSSCNDNIPVMALSENIAYNMPGFYSEFPEAISDTDLPYSQFASQGAYGVSQYQQFDALGQPQPRAQFLPQSGQNGCTDSSAVAIGSYPNTVWGTPKSDNSNQNQQGVNNMINPFQPVSTSEYEELNAKCNTQTGATGASGADFVPKIVANMLLFNMGASCNGLALGPLWMKDSPPRFINCAVLGDWTDPQHGQGDPQSIAANIPDVWMPGFNAGILQSLTSATNLIWGYNYPTAGMPGIIGVYYNFITDGGLSAAGFPTLFMGPATFIDRQTVFGGSPIEGSGSSPVDRPIYNYFFSGLGGTVDDVFGDLFKRSVMKTSPWLANMNVPAGSSFPVVLQIIDVDAGKVKRYQLLGQGATELGGWTSFDRVKLMAQRSQKGAYMCAGSSGNWSLLMQQGKPVIDFMVGPIFESERGGQVDNDMCTGLSEVLPRMAPVDLTFKKIDYELWKREEDLDACAETTGLSLPPLGSGSGAGGGGCAGQVGVSRELLFSSLPLPCPSP